MTTMSLSIINVSTNKETALTMNTTYINLNPDFQREYDAWNSRLKTRFIETMLLGRAMNPIWTIFNPNEQSQEILDGMHRLTTAIHFLNDKFLLKGKHFTNDIYKKYDNKTFSELEPNDQQKIRNYNFTFNHLDDTFRKDINKRRDMYEVLNRSSKTLNDYEFDKVLYNGFYRIISTYKTKMNEFFRKNDSRGAIEIEIINLLVLSEVLPSSWSSINTLRQKYLSTKLGNSEETVNKYLNENTQIIKEKLEFIIKIISRLTHEELFSKQKKIFKKNRIPYKFFISRLCFKLHNISLFNRHIVKLISLFKKKVINIDIQEKLECPSRNSMFQRKLIEYIDNIIDLEYDKTDVKNNRLFNTEMKEKKLIEQNNKCNVCKKIRKQYEADHIRAWSLGGKTEYSNLQMICIQCHRNKTARLHG